MADLAVQLEEPAGLLGQIQHFLVLLQTVVVLVLVWEEALRGVTAVLAAAAAGVELAVQVVKAATAVLLSQLTALGILQLVAVARLNPVQTELERKAVKAGTALHQA